MDACKSESHTWFNFPKTQKFDFSQNFDFDCKSSTFCKSSTRKTSIFRKNSIILPKNFDFPQKFYFSAHVKKRKKLKRISSIFSGCNQNKQYTEQITACRSVFPSPPPFRRPEAVPELRAQGPDFADCVGARVILVDIAQSSRCIRRLGSAISAT